MSTTGETRAAGRIREIESTSVHRSPHAFIDKRGEPMLIRVLKPARHQEFLRMYLNFRPRNAFHGLPPLLDQACIAWVRRMLRDAVNLVVVSFDRGMVGHSALFPMSETRCELLSAVVPGFQRVGIGTQVTRCAIQTAYELGYQNVWLCVEVTNRVARHVYQKCGFEYVTDSDPAELEMTYDLSAYDQASDVTAADIMKTEVVSVGERTSCREAARRCLAHHVAALPVTDSEGQLAGIVSETDLIGVAALNQTVGDVLTRDVVSVCANTPLHTIVRLFRSRHLRYLPVLGAGNRVVGIVGRHDVLAYYLHAFGSTTGRASGGAP